MKICCNMDQKITNTIINKQCRSDFLGFESLGYIEPNTLLCSIYMNSTILLSVLPFSDGLNLFKQVGVSVYIICIRALYSWSIRGFSINHKFAINSSRKNVNNFCVTEINMSIKGSTVNQKVFPFSSVLLKLKCNTQDAHFYDSAFYNSKETKLISDIINLLVPEIAGWNY